MNVVKVDLTLTEEEVRKLLLLLQGLVEEPWVSIRTKLQEAVARNG